MESKIRDETRASCPYRFIKSAETAFMYLHLFIYYKLRGVAHQPRTYTPFSPGPLHLPGDTTYFLRRRSEDTNNAILINSQELTRAISPLDRNRSASNRSADNRVSRPGLIRFDIIPNRNAVGASGSEELLGVIPGEAVNGGGGAEVEGLDARGVALLAQVEDGYCCLPLRCRCEPVAVF